MKLFDDNNIRHITHSSDRFLYSPQNQKPTSNKKKTENKKYNLFSEALNLFEDEPIEFNDLDFNILNRNLIRYLPTDSLRLELQIERGEKRLNRLNEEIKACEMLELQEIANEEFLKKSKKKLVQEINSYKHDYRKLGYIYKLADAFSDAKTYMQALLNSLDDFFTSNKLLIRILQRIPVYAEKQKIRKINLLQKKLFSEIKKKNTRIDRKRLEYLFIKTEKLRGIGYTDSNK